MAVTFKRLTKFHPYEPAKCNSFVVGEHQWDAQAYCSVRHHPCFFLGALLCPLCMLHRQRMQLLLHDRENFVCCIKCPQWQKYEGACIGPAYSPCCNVLEIALCPVCAAENNRHSVRKYYNLVEEPQLRCLRMEFDCAKFSFGSATLGSSVATGGDGSGECSGGEDESGGEGERVAERNAERGQPLTWLGALLMTVFQQPASCVAGCFGYLACLGCRLIHVPFILTQHHHELTKLNFPHYRPKPVHLLDNPYHPYGFNNRGDSDNDLGMLML